MRETLEESPDSCSETRLVTPSLHGKPCVRLTSSAVVRINGLKGLVVVAALVFISALAIA